MSATQNVPQELTQARSRTATDATLPPTLCQLPGASFMALCQHTFCSVENPPAVLCADDNCNCRRPEVCNAHGECTDSGHWWHGRDA